MEQGRSGAAARGWSWSGGREGVRSELGLEAEQNWGLNRVWGGVRLVAELGWGRSGAGNIALPPCPLWGLAPAPPHAPQMFLHGPLGGHTTQFGDHCPTDLSLQAGIQSQTTEPMQSPTDVNRVLPTSLLQDQGLSAQSYSPHIDKILTEIKSFGCKGIIVGISETITVRLWTVPVFTLQKE